MSNALQSPNDPIRVIKRRVWATWLVGSLAIASCAFWALPPADDPDQPHLVTTLAEPSTEPISDDSPPAFDDQSFSARLWNPPQGSEPAPPAPKAARRPPPPRLELIAIINDGGERRAAVYNPDTDRIRIVGSGDQISELTVTSVSADAVELSDGRATVRLTLKEERS